ncbi:HK97 family phage portal protein [Candidatus Cyrtobacter comes]|uniref:HK97 family phage portal protein n=1 Tax=Candidatus Cyrtobacter comes TaxID=675776 RepID=A0ABU5L8X3_9RICK|nr:phage portal protein [Candidatus Cyrtobacter comes]MDZ5762571.1 HK97 family phage portal protein [Candidatus Cyrtobacter comes]
MFDSIKSIFKDKVQFNESYLYQIGKPVWSNRSYTTFADKAYIKNVIANRSIRMISTCAASIVPIIYKADGAESQIRNRIEKLLKEPNPIQNGFEFFESIYTYRQLYGNAYILASQVGRDSLPLEIYLLRPERVKIIAGEQFLPLGYRYTVENKNIDYMLDSVTGKGNILHIKNFNPVSDWYGLSPVEAASYSIDQHNQAAEWNQSLLQSGARPSGVITVKDSEGKPSTLTREQFYQIKEMISECFSGPKNSGRPMVLEGGLEWKEMSMSPKDMDFIESKNSSARDIALAFGVPPQLLGIPGDNTYNNLREARIALWEEVVLPMVDNTFANISRWINKNYELDIEIKYDRSKISALASKSDSVWERLQNVTFMTTNEKREYVGLHPLVEQGNYTSS